jgi:4-amino-4-deoxy-L-arabinose transferase-like glycosyltransferase
LAASRAIAPPASRSSARLDWAAQLLILLLAIWMIRGLLYVFVNPPFESPDESSHLEYVSSFYESGGSRVTGAEAHQPPLYYLATLPLYAPFASQPPEVSPLAMRLTSLLMGAGTLVLAYLIARRLCPDQPFVYLGTAAFVALLPKFGHISASANNDNLANLLSAAIIWLLLVGIQLGLTPRRVLAMAALAGLALATKATTWPVIAVAAMVVAATVLRWAFNRDRAATVLGVALLSLLAAILPAYPSSSSIVQLMGGLLGAGFFD